MRTVLQTSFSLVISFTAVIIASQCAVQSAEAQQSSVDVSVEVTRSTFKSSDPRIDTNIGFVNKTSGDIRILKWDTPFENEAGRINGDYLNVFRGQERVTYIGPIFKRAAPTAEDYIVLKPGAKLSSRVNLEDGYALLSSGVYTVSFKTESVDMLSPAINPSAAPRLLSPLEKAAAPRMASSSVASFVLTDGRASNARLASAVPLQKFEACAADQQAALSDAVPKAQGIASLAQLTLGTTGETERANGVRYATWFGAYSEERYTKVASHFAAISDALRSPQVTFNCGGNRCSSSTYAYVFPTQPYRIYPCAAFWRADLAGTDSKAGTLVHEMSHFNIVGGTLDIVYGQAGASDLAKKAPDDAIRNADSHEYFAENMPELSMKVAAGAVDKQESATKSK